MPKRSPYLLGITGNIACGKSLVSSILAELGAEVIDADRVAHELMHPGSSVVKQIVSEFGDNVVNADGSLNRAALGQIVFQDPRALATLEHITHPPTVQTILDRATRSAASVVVIDAIKLFEASLASQCQENWTVYCDPSVQLQRLMERNRFDASQARQRIDAQPPQEDKMRRSDVVIDNSGEIADTREQVLRNWNRLRSS